MKVKKVFYNFDYRIINYKLFDLIVWIIFNFNLDKMWIVLYLKKKKVFVVMIKDYVII